MQAENMDICLYGHVLEMALWATQIGCMTVGLRGRPVTREMMITVNEAKHHTPPLQDEYHMIVIHPPLSQPLLDQPSRK